MKLLENIATGMDSYTRTEKKIAEYIVNNVLEFTLSTIGSVAEELDISKTSLNRFAKSFGFEGYSQFRKKLQEEELVNVKPADRFKKLSDRKNISHASLLSEKEIENIKQCMDNLDGKSLDKLIDRIEAAGHIYVCGFDMASFLAEILCRRMVTFGYPFIYLEGQRASFRKQMMFSEDEDVLIVFDFPDYSDYCRDAVLYAREHDILVVLVTDYVTCPLIKYADMIYYCDSQTDLFKNSLVTPIFFVNLLISAIVYKNDEKIMNFFEKMEERGGDSHEGSY